MGIYDRDYYRRPARGGFGQFEMWSATTWLIVLNAIVFLLDLMLKRDFAVAVPVPRSPFPALFGPLEFWGYFSIDTAVYQLQLWRIVSCQFLHASFSHLFWNMLGLYFFGQIVEAYFGSRRFLAFYLLCGCAGVVCYTLLGFSGVLRTDQGTPLVGASAGIFGVLVAAALIAPNLEVMLMFPPIPVPLKFLAIFMMGVALFTTFNNGHNAGGEAAHLGGGLLGYLLYRFPRSWTLPGSRGRRAGARMRFSDWSKDMNR
jgi:membrane associated rhomboid family serine protease